MLFSRIADAVLRHPKAIALIWVAVLALSVYPALHATDHLDYSVSGMSGGGESAEGAEIVGEHFDTGGSAEDTVLVVVSFPAGGEDAAEAVGNELTALASEESSKYGSVTAAGTFPGEDGGISLFAVSYDDRYGGSISKDTPHVRDMVAQAVGGASAGGADVSGIGTYVTGSPAVSYDMEKGALSDVSRIDPFSILLVLLLVGLFFRSFVTSAMPPLTVGVAFAAAMCALFFIAQAVDVFYITEMLILVSMLGAGCDYCIFILARYREERRGGKGHEEAVRQAVTWAGESIATSGLAVIIGFGSMTVCSFQMISTMGLVLAVGIVMALLAAMFLMSSLLAMFGDRMFWPSSPDSGRLDRGWYAKMTHLAHRYFEGSAKFSIKHAKAIVAAAVLFTVPMMYVYEEADTSYDMVGSLACGESQDGLEEIEEYTYGGMIMPDYAVVSLGSPIADVTVPADPLTGETLGVGSLAFRTGYEEDLALLNSLSDDIRKSDPENIGSVTHFVSWEQIVQRVDTASGGLVDAGSMEPSALIDLIERSGSLDPASLSALRTMDESIAPNVPALKSYWPDIAYVSGNEDLAHVYDWAMFYRAGSLGGDERISSLNGQPALGVAISYARYAVITVDQAMSDRSLETVGSVTDTVRDFDDAHAEITGSWITGSASSMYDISERVDAEFAGVEALAVVLIIILLFAVMRSYLTPIRSVLTILMSVVWTVAVTHLLFGSILGDGVIWLIPIILLVVCLGLGMDYDILLTTRIRENRVHRGMDNDGAIAAAVTRSGSVITVCGLIMGGAFGTLMLSSTTMLQEFGFALMFAILVDALVVRTYVVPAAMHLMGEWNWKGPKWMSHHGRE